MTSPANTETGELIEPLSNDEAERLSNRIGLRLDTIADNYVAVVPMIREAIERQAHVALGYRSPGEYAAARFGDALSKLGAEMRQAVVRELADLGMSTRAIAPIVGSSHMTVARDLAGVTDVTPARTDVQHDHTEYVDGCFRCDLSREEATPETPEGEVRPDSGRTAGSSQAQDAASPRPPVTGIDGKTYTQPAPKPRPLKPVADEFTDQDRAEELARNLARNLSLLYALTNPERRAEYIATWRDGTADLKPLGWDFITPTHMRDLSAALLDFATEWEQNNG